MGRVLPLLAGPAAVLAAAPTPSSSWRGVLATTTTRTTDPTAPVVHLVALAAWAGAAWLLVLVTATLLAAVPGAAGAAATTLTRCLAPRVKRSALRVALGVAVASAGSTGTALAAGAPVPTPATQPHAVLAPGFDWPGLVRPSPPRAAAPPPAATAQPTRARPAPTTPPAPVGASGQVVVRPGDCLWDLADRALGGHAAPARIAAVWPAWWQANRAVIGTDPDLLRPGMHLRRPTPPRARRPSPGGPRDRPPPRDHPARPPVAAPGAGTRQRPTVRRRAAQRSRPAAGPHRAPGTTPPAGDAPDDTGPGARRLAGPGADAHLAALPATRPYARSLVQVLVEVLAGVRPLTQLRRETTPELYALIGTAVVRTPRTIGARPDGRAVRSVHVQQRPEAVVEVCATVVRGGRPSALALRLEGLDGRWRCTELAGL